MKSEAQATAAIERYANTVRRICFMHLKSHADVEDVFQEVFLKYILYEPCFESENHEKAWLLRVAINQCKDVLKSSFKKRVCSIEDADMPPLVVKDDAAELLDAVLQLPERYRDVIYLYYYEGYTTAEIAKMLGRNENTIYTWMTRARTKLKKTLGGGSLDE